MNSSKPLQRDLVLVGGGHSHLAVIRHFGMQPQDGLRITLVSQAAHTVYSGMLPGTLAGHYQPRDGMIDLRRLCQWAGIRLFQAEARRIDSAAQHLCCEARPPLRYDWLSVNVGSVPDTSAIQDAGEFGQPVKPLDDFRRKLSSWLQQLERDGIHRTLSVIGGGAASVEVILAIAHRLADLQHLGRLDLQLVSNQGALLPGHNPRVSAYFTHLLASRGIKLQLNYTVERLSKQAIHGTGPDLPSNYNVLATHAGAPRWLEQSGLDLDGGGFIRVNQQLQSVSHGNVFAAGDCASMDGVGLPRSGVYAVRQGPLLARNLRRAVEGSLCADTAHSDRPWPYWPLATVAR